MRALVDALAEAAEDEVRHAAGGEGLGLHEQAEARLDLAIDDILETGLLVRHGAEDQQRPRPRREASGAERLAERIDGCRPERLERRLRGGGLGGVGGGESPRGPARLVGEPGGADEAQHGGADAGVAVVRDGRGGPAASGAIRSCRVGRPRRPARARRAADRRGGRVERPGARGDGRRRRAGLDVGTQQLGAELLADDLSRRRVVALERRGEARPPDRRRLRGGRAPPPRRRAPPRARRGPPASSTGRHSAAVAAGPSSRAYAWTRFARSIVSSPSGARQERRHRLRGLGAQDRRVLEDAVERRDEEPPIGGRRPPPERSAERRDGATRRRLDDQRAGRAAACEVGADEARAEPAERRGVEERGEGVVRAQRPRARSRPSRGAASGSATRA